MKTVTLVLVSALAVAGCGSVVTTYAPHSAIAQAPCTGQALRFYEGDMAAVAGAGGQLLGRLEVSGYASYDRIRDEATATVARQGGTHFILDEDDVAQRFTDLAAGKPVAERSIAPFRSSADTPAEESLLKRKKVIYLVVRVAPEQWMKLPEKLRPAGFSPAAPGGTSVVATRS